MVHNKPVQITIDAPGLAEVLIDLIVWHGLPQPLWLDRTSRLNRYLKVLFLFVLRLRRQTNYNPIYVIDRLKKMLRDEPVQISQCTRAGGDKFRRFNSISRSSRLSEETRSLPPSSGSPGTTFRLGCDYTPSSSTVLTTHTSSMKILNGNLMITCHKNLPHGLDLANPFPPDLWGYAYGFNYWFNL